MAAPTSTRCSSDVAVFVNGNNHQIDRIGAEVTRRDLHVHIVVDFIHVLEYLWSAA